MTDPPADGDVPYAGPPHTGSPGYGPQYGPPSYGPPSYGPPSYGPPSSGPPSYGQPPHGQPPYGPAWGPSLPPGPQRPGAVIAAAVLVFASALLVALGTVYALAFSALLSLSRGSDSGIGLVAMVLQLLLAGLLVVGGLRVLDHDRRWLLGAVVGQLALSVYWVVVFADLASSTFGDGVLAVPLIYAALALLAGGLTFLPEARAWTSGRPDAGG